MRGDRKMDDAKGGVRCIGNTTCTETETERMYRRLDTGKHAGEASERNVMGNVHRITARQKRTKLNANGGWGSHYCSKHEVGNFRGRRGGRVAKKTGTERIPGKQNNKE